MAAVLCFPFVFKWETEQVEVFYDMASYPACFHGSILHLRGGGDNVMCCLDERELAWQFFKN